MPQAELDRHAQFIATYAGKRDRWYVLGNARSVRPDIRSLESALGIGGMEELRASIEVLPQGIEHEMLDEAVRCRCRSPTCGNHDGRLRP